MTSLPSRPLKGRDPQFEESERQLEANQKLIETVQRHYAECDDQLKTKKKVIEITTRQQREIDELRERQRQNEDRYERLLEK